jgi:hypothetical protein
LPTFKRIPTGNEDLDRVQQNVEQAFAGIPAPVAPNVVTVTSDYQVNGSEDVIHVNSQSGPVRVTLQRPSSANRPLVIKQTNTPTAKGKVNPVTVATADGSKTIAGLSTIALDPSGTGSVSITADSSQHWPSTGGSAPVAPTPANPSGSPGGGGGGTTRYTGLAPILVSGTVISVQSATESSAGSLSAADKTTIDNLPTTYTPLSRLINTTAPLTGGGSLASDLTLGLATDSTLAVVSSQLGRAAISGDVVIGAGSNTSAISAHVVTYGKMQQETAQTILCNPTGSLADTQAISLGTGMIFQGVGPGVFVLTNSSPLTSLIANVPLTFDGVNTLSAPGVLYTNGGPGSVDLGALASGVLQQTVTGGVSTPGVFSATTNLIPFGASTGGGFQQSTSFLFNGTGMAVGQTTVDAKFHLVTNNDTTPTTVAAWDGRHLVVGQSTSTGGGLAFSYDASTTTGNIICAQPNTAWNGLSVYASGMDVFVGGSTHALNIGNTGGITFPAYGAGGLLYAAGSSGAVGLATISAPLSYSGGTLAVGYDNASITLNGSNQLQRAALGGDLSSSAGSNTVNVVALHETSGPTRLSINAVPDSSPFATVLVRPTGTATVVGVSSDILIPNFVGSGVGHAHGLVPDPGAVAGTSRYLREDATWVTPFIVMPVSYWCAGVNPIAGGWAAPSSTSLLSSDNPQLPLAIVATSARLLVLIEANTLSTSLGTGVMTFAVQRNGSTVTSVTALTNVSVGTVLDTGVFTALGTSATTDKWALKVSSTGSYVSGSISFSASMQLGYNA